MLHLVFLPFYYVTRFRSIVHFKRDGSEAFSPLSLGNIHDITKVILMLSVCFVQTNQAGSFISLQLNKISYKCDTLVWLKTMMLLCLLIMNIVQTHIHTRSNTHTQTHRHTHAHTRAHTRTHARTHTHTHTHTRTRFYMVLCNSI